MSTTEVQGAARRLGKADIDRVVEIDTAIRARRAVASSKTGWLPASPTSRFISLGYEENGRIQGLCAGAHARRRIRRPASRRRARCDRRRQRGARPRRRSCADEELQTAACGRGAHSVRTQVAWPNEPLMHFLAAGTGLGTRLVLGRPCAKFAGEMRPGEAEKQWRGPFGGPGRGPLADHRRPGPRSSASRDITGATAPPISSARSTMSSARTACACRWSRRSTTRRPAS